MINQIPGMIDFRKLKIRLLEQAYALESSSTIGWSLVSPRQVMGGTGNDVNGNRNSTQHYSL
jgi:hypothetical protein